MGKTSLLSSKTWAGSRKGKYQGGCGGCSCRALPASLPGTSTGPCSSFLKLSCLRSQGLLCRACGSDSSRSSLRYKTHRFICGSI